MVAHAFWILSFQRALQRMLRGRLSDPQDRSKDALVNIQFCHFPQYQLPFLLMRMSNLSFHRFALGPLFLMRAKALPCIFPLILVGSRMQAWLLIESEAESSSSAADIPFFVMLFSSLT